MSGLVVKQPDGFFAIFDKIIDDFVITNATEEEIMRYFIGEKVIEVIRLVESKLDKAKNPHPHDFTYKKAIEKMKIVHGENNDEI